MATQSSAETVTVTANKVTTGIDAAMLPGGVVKGTVTTAVKGQGLTNVCVEAVPVGSDTPVDFITALPSSGSYSMTGLAAGSYDIEFSTALSGPTRDKGNCGSEAFAIQWWNHQPTRTSATAVKVTPGSTVTTIDAALFPAIPPPPATSTSHASGSSTTRTGTVKADTTTAKVTAQATGIGAVTVAKYGSNPTTGSLSNGSDEYFDVKVSGSRSFTSLAVTDCGLNGGDTLYWWTGSAYKPVSPAATPGPPGCLTFTASATSSPSLTALTGTIFAVASAVVPARPTAPTAKPGNTQVTVTWQAPTTGGSSITSYKVTSSPGTKFCTWSSGPLTCTVLGLSNGTKYTFTVTAHNSVGTGPASAASNGVVPRSTPSITTTTLPAATVGTRYSSQVVVSGGTSPFKWSISSGGLPPGLRLNATTGAITGTPTPAVSTAPYTATYTFAVTVNDANTLHSSKTLRITVTSTGKPVITTSSLPAGTVGSQYSAQLAVKLSNAPFAWSVVSGTLPAGLSLDATTGAISGVPTSATTAGLTFKVIGGNKLSTTASLPLTVNAAPAAHTSGYDLVGSDGGVFVFSPPGTSGGFYGSLPGLHISVHNIVGMVPTATDQGYFLVGSDGGVFAFGNAPFLGSLPELGVTPSQPISGLVATGTDGGYFLVGKDGGVFAFGNAPFLGSLPGIGVHRDDIIGIAATPSGDGYWLVAATGTVYGFGAAQTLGSATGTSSPVSAIAGTPDGGGYWIVTQNGAIYPFGDARSFGTLPTLGVSPALPVIGVVHTADTAGYWLIGADGGIFAFGDAGFVGSLPGVGVHVTNIVGAVPTLS